MTYYLQVKSSGQWLNIEGSSNQVGAVACQGDNPITPNFEWELIPATAEDSGGYFLLQVKSSGQYLNILGESGQIGAKACQGNNATTDNYFWQVIPAGGIFFTLQVKSSGQWLNIEGASNQNGAFACQGNDPTTDNYLWTINLAVPE